ncbi:MAG: aldehyde dehydrogenase family protein [Chloroflexota bacterium]|nr:aldehyde dehydrogenase family protein [Chloroflexota bacterium]
MNRVAQVFQSMTYGPAPEASDAARAWIAAHTSDSAALKLFIDNRWVASSDRQTYETHNPATGDLLARVADGGEADVDVAVRAARRAFGAWSAAAGHVRARHLYAIARAIQKHARLFAVLEALDNGKSIRETRDLDIPLVARHFYHHAGWAQLFETELAGYQPLGVVGQVIPWNFPLLMLAWKIAPAIALGNTIVIKPAPATPLTALLFAEIAADAGLPPGVINVVTGGDRAGAALTAHADIDKIAFTGSTNVGRIIRRVTAGTGKRLSLELGGKSPFVVFDDADQDAAIEGLVDAIWFNQGQVCCAGSRVLVQEDIADGFLDKVRTRMAKLRVGDSLDKGIDIGAIVDAQQRDIIDGWVKRGVAEGADLFQPNIELPTTGCWYLPTLLTNVQPASSVAQEEIFGPVAVAMTFRTPKEAVALANNTRYGLAASIWTENVNLALDIARRVKAGSVWVNCTNMFDAAAGFGGYRESGFGREGGREGLYEYIRPVWEVRPRPAVPENADVSQWAAHVPTLPKPLNGGHANGGIPALDRTAKLFIGGKQARSDGNYSRPVLNADGDIVGEVSDGNRKDIRDAVEAAHAASGWAYRSGHQRAQILYYIAENLNARADEFARRIASMTGAAADAAAREVAAAVDRWFTYAAYADKYGGTVQETTLRGIVMALVEPIGVIGIACPDAAPLLAFTSLVAPAIARGNTVVAIASETYPLSATDFYQVLETSDVPAGVVNIVTGARDHLTRTLAEHDAVDALWHFGGAVGSYYVEQLSASNMKRTWVDYGVARDWYDAHQGAGAEFLREATQVKNIWVPSGE